MRRLGDAFGLTWIGANLVTIFPGKESSMRHHHTHEDELIYMLEGELVLRTIDGKESLRPGMVAGFRAGDGNGHPRATPSCVGPLYAPATRLFANARSTTSRRTPGDQ
ncbi:MAG: putative sugar oxidoreductase [Myxococcales bacterium]|nr:putative sugar oxidoreductase [Myxococcales bacterium]